MSRMKKHAKEQEPFNDLNVYFPNAVREKLKEQSEITGVPMSRLVLYAVDNELCSPNPFAYHCPYPLNTFIEHAYTEEAQKIYRYLFKFASGAGRDLLMLCRFDIGIPNKETFMLAYRELMEAGMIEEKNPPPRAKFDYPKGYKYTRLANMALDKKKRDALAALEILEEEQEKRRPYDTETT